MLANILGGFFLRQHVGSHSKSRQHVGQQMLASNVAKMLSIAILGQKTLHRQLNKVIPFDMYK